MAEVFGSPSQNRMQIRGEVLMRLLSNDPRYCSHGRGVQVVDHDEDAADLVEALVRLLGASGCEMVEKPEAQAFQSELQQRGMKTDIIHHFFGGPDCIEIARDTLATRPLPKDLTVRIIDRSAPADWLRAYADVAMPHGVLPPIGAVMRGVSRPGFAMVAFDRNDRPVATAGSVQSHHPDHPHAGRFQWGQLATVADRQGEGIARAMGALAILHAAEAFGARDFRTGIAPGNTASARLCESLGLSDSPYDIVAGMDPEAFADDRLTK